MHATDAAEAVRLAHGLLAHGPEPPPAELEVTGRPLRGGLMADLIHISAKWPGCRAEQFVLKRVSGSSREVDAYAALARCGLADIGPRLLGASVDRASSYLLLEYVSRWKPWPWRDEAYAGMVLDTLARLHAAPLSAVGDGPRSTEYPSGAAEYALDLLRTAAGRIGDPRLRRGVRAVSTLVGRLAEAHVLLAEAPVFLHGDVHPGNALVRGDGGPRRAVLLDWGRARVGSRFEDVASWLQCLRYFEYAAIGAHDRLLLRYIRAAGLGDRISPRHRREYWVAAGCNALAGALGVHLARALGVKSPRARMAAVAAAVDWLRIVRRAVAHLDRQPLLAHPSA